MTQLVHPRIVGELFGDGVTHEFLYDMVDTYGSPGFDVNGKQIGVVDELQIFTQVFRCVIGEMIHMFKQKNTAIDDDTAKAAVASIVAIYLK